jgi:HEAT repeat protein
LPEHRRLLGSLLLAGVLFASPSGGENKESEATNSASWNVLRRALASQDYATRLLATEALGTIRPVDAASWVEPRLADPEHDVRVAAVDALSKIGTRRALHLLTSVRDDDKEALDVRALAAAALIDHSQPQGGP